MVFPYPKIVFCEGISVTPFLIGYKLIGNLTGEKSIATKPPNKVIFSGSKVWEKI